MDTDCKSCVRDKRLEVCDFNGICYVGYSNVFLSQVYNDKDYTNVKKKPGWLIYHGK